ncbi:MAG: helix-turn-helix domain-containing protein, partial [Nitrososphaeraceae archaeon]
MRPRTPEIARNMVIEKWLRGKSRNQIAEECGLGRGTVSTIIDEWSRLTGKELAVQYRDFGLVLNKSGLSFTDCVTGRRVASSAKNLGIDLDELEHFLTEVYTPCVSK